MSFPAASGGILRLRCQSSRRVLLPATVKTFFETNVFMEQDSIADYNGGEDRTRHKGSIIKRVAPLFFLLFLFVMVSLSWPEECLTAESGGKLLFALPIHKGDVFEVGFTHSLNLSPVIDVIEWTKNGMILRKSMFKTFGAGIPVPSDGIGTELVHVNDRYELLGIDKPLRNFSIMTQTIPNHYILFKGSEISLLDLVEPGKVVEVAVKNVPRFTRLRKNS